MFTVAMTFLGYSALIAVAEVAILCMYYGNWMGGVD